MSYLEYERLAAEWLAGQKDRKIDFEWEIQHHNQMHAAYEQNLKD